MSCEPRTEEVAIRMRGLAKRYEIYRRPSDRLKQSLRTGAGALLGLEPARYFDEFWALRGVSFDVRRGETVGVVGRNGSGKSTLLQIVCGTLAPTEGEISTHGRIAALLELGSGFNPEFSGRANVFLNAAILGIAREEAEARFDAIAAFADIGPFIDQPVKTYSSGMVVRLAFAVAINVDPQILVVDEALSVGDEVFQRKCYSRIEEIKRRGATILFVSHAAGAVIELCDRAVLLDSGEMLAIGDPKAVIAQYQRLIYAPPERQADVRASMLAASAPAVSAAASLEASGAAAEVPQDAGQPDEYFDPGLVPSSTIAYETRGAAIEEPEIVNEAGARVNCLVRGRTYRYRYKVRFEQGAEQVRFGMMVKVLSGLEVGGAASCPSPRDAIAYVAAGSIAHVEFRFRCSLNSGTYFMNAGVLGKKGDEEVFLHRVLDLFAFRVLPVKGNITTGIVHLDCEPRISIAARDAAAEAR
jgi:lipopolysaccharide transport system ATP-binding protein